MYKKEFEEKVNSTVARNLRRYLELNNMTQVDLAKKMGVTTATTSNWCKGVKMPRMDKIDKLCAIFKISRSELIEDHLEPSNVTPVDLDQSSKISGVSIPIVGTIVAGMPVDAYEDILGYEEISATLAKTGDFVCLRVRGDSMSPKIEAGDLVIVRLQSDVDSGDVAVVKINGDETTLKKVQKSEAGITLIAYNPAVYEPHFYNNEEIENLPVVVCGKVVEMKRSF